MQYRRAGETSNCCSWATHTCLFYYLPRTPWSSSFWMHTLGKKKLCHANWNQNISPQLHWLNQNPLLFLTAQAETGGRNNPPSVRTGRWFCTLHTKAKKHLGIWQEPWTTGAMPANACTNAKLLWQLVCLYLYRTASKGFLACDGTLVFLKQVLLSATAKWTTRLKATKNYAPFEVGQTSSSPSNTWQKLRQAVYLRRNFIAWWLCVTIQKESFLPVTAICLFFKE